MAKEESCSWLGNIIQEQCSITRKERDYNGITGFECNWSIILYLKEEYVSCKNHSLLITTNDTGFPRKWIIWNTVLQVPNKKWKWKMLLYYATFVRTENLEMNSLLNTTLSTIQKILIIHFLPHALFYFYIFFCDAPLPLETTLPKWVWPRQRVLQNSQSPVCWGLTPCQSKHVLFKSGIELFTKGLSHKVYFTSKFCQNKSLMQSCETCLEKSIAFVISSELVRVFLQRAKWNECVRSHIQMFKNWLRGECPRHRAKWFIQSKSIIIYMKCNYQRCPLLQFLENWNHLPLHVYISLH